LKFEAAGIPSRASVGDRWNLGRHSLIVGDAKDQVPPADADIVFDPPWEDFTLPPLPTSPATTLLFSDSLWLGRHLERLGLSAADISYLFVWDGQRSRLVSHRPPQRLRFCLWFGDVSTYPAKGVLMDVPLERRRTPAPRIVTKYISRAGVRSPKPHTFIEDVRGNLLTDIYRELETTHMDDPAVDLGDDVSDQLSDYHSQILQRTYHAHAKPLRWIRALVSATTKPDATIYDPYLGSGTTLLACELAGRSCVGVELLPRVADLVITRWEALSGQTATSTRP